ncbi:hypothetical protein HPB50_017352 [Hyalomma asiaticum]|uniref:Uncharacterized protein n=1 Tax=Hyalomma asiaticum TaxID=266040 RepID=A0ACB7S9G6_HYAAI|nr:hypothetical protein HPB50_017352 [Hyalomma asiaticum]
MSPGEFPTERFASDEVCKIQRGDLTLPEHETKEAVAEKGSGIGMAATDMVVQECYSAEENRGSKSSHKSPELRERGMTDVVRKQRQGHSRAPKAEQVGRGIVETQSEGAGVVDMPAKDGAYADNLPSCSAGVEVPEKYGGRLSSTSAVASLGQREIGPQKGFIPGSAQASAQVVGGRERDTSESEKGQVVSKAGDTGSCPSNGTFKFERELTLNRKKEALNSTVQCHMRVLRRSRYYSAAAGCANGEYLAMLDAQLLHVKVRKSPLAMRVTLGDPPSPHLLATPSPEGWEEVPAPRHAEEAATSSLDLADDLAP